MEKQRCLAPAGEAVFYLGALQGQNRPDLARYLGGLGAADGDYLFAAISVAVPALQHRADFLGAAADLHDQSVRWKNRSGRADRTLGHARFVAAWWTKARKLSSCAPKDEIARNFPAHSAAASRSDFHFPPD